MFSRDVLKLLSRALVVAFSVTVLCIMFSSTAAAQPWNKKTTVTFSGPVEIPGAGAQVLPAGTYVFKLLDSQSNRHIVQVFSQDEKKIYATILAIPNYRLKPTDKTVMTFGERAVGEPQAIRAWFYPGNTSGQEFVYPKKRATELARATDQPVLYIPDEAAPYIMAPAKTGIEPPIVALKEEPVMIVKPTGEVVAMPEVTVAPPLEKPAELPKTASELPLLTLVGLLCLGVGVALRTLCGR
jgi:hypothetical protein